MDNRNKGWYVILLQPLQFVGASLFFLSWLFKAPSFLMIKTAYDYLTLLLPALLLLGGIAGLIYNRRERKRWLGRAAVACLVAALGCVGVRVYATHIEPRLLQVRHVTIKSSKVWRPLRILHITDVQSDRVGDYEERVFKTMRELEPDLVLFTGDLVQPKPPRTVESETAKLATLFETLQPPLGVYCIYGNLDGPYIHALERGRDGQIQILRSRGVDLKSKGVNLRIYGLAAVESQSLHIPPASLMQWLHQNPSAAFTIVMGHRPDFVLPSGGLALDLCLSGHTHGGQLRVPFIGPILIGCLVPHTWARGYREVGRLRLNVSAGIGTEHAAGMPAMRINCPPEMTLITLLPK